MPLCVVSGKLGSALHTLLGTNDPAARATWALLRVRLSRRAAVKLDLWQIRFRRFAPAQIDFPGWSIKSAR